MSRNDARGEVPDPLHMPANRYQSSLLKCSNCSARGAATWEQKHDDKGSHLALVKVSGEFHIEKGRTVPDNDVIVCNQCDEINNVSCYD
jgi:hypothetical protein